MPKSFHDGINWVFGHEPKFWPAEMETSLVPQHCERKPLCMGVSLEGSSPNLGFLSLVSAFQNKR